jgi:predicted Zn-dependent protease
MEYGIVIAVIVGFVALIFWGIGLLVDNLVWLIPPAMEQQLGNIIVPEFAKQAKPSPAQTKLNQLLDQLETHLPNKSDRDYQLLYIPAPTINALAIPGDTIVVYQGLLRKIESENELMMILGHELGHFANRDHLRGITRSLALQVLLAVVFGDSGVGSWAGGALEAVANATYSQGQELQADEFGLYLLAKHYHHVAGAVDFFHRIKDQGYATIPFLASHPHPQARIDRLEHLIKSQGYSIGRKTPLPSILRS